MGFTFSRRKHGRKVSYKSKKRRCTTINSHANIRKSDNLNTSNSDDVIGNSKLPHINVQTEILFNKIITIQTETVTESSISINNETIDENNITEEILSHHNSAQVIDPTSDENRNNLLNSEEEADVK